MRGVQGFLLPSVLAVMAVSMLVGALAFVLVSGNLRNTQAAVETSRAQLAAEAGLEEAVAAVWHRLFGDVPRSRRSLQEYVRRVENLTRGGNPIYLEDTLPDGSRFRAEIQPLGRSLDSGSRVVYRFRVRSEGRAPGEGVRVLEENLVVGVRPFPFDFALLTNNVNCILCHANISSLDRLRGTPNPNNPETWWRPVKVGTLEHLEMRSDPDSTIHGTLYSRGNVTMRSSAPTLYFTLQDGQEEIRSLQRRQVGRAVFPVDCSDPANCPARRPFYQNYPTSERLGDHDWPDGELVDSFPVPIPDTNGNRQIDDEEWRTATEGSLSGSSDEYPPGTLTARMAVFTQVPAILGWQVASSTQQVETATLADNPRKLVVIDAEAEPLEISGTVFINGDVILRGRVRGNGTLLARGNIYVMGDLVYDCGEGVQKRVCDYRDPSRLPALSLVAGGNVVIGDYLSPLGGSRSPLDVEHGFEGGNNTSLNFVAVEVGNFNRLELLKASQALARGEAYVPRFYRFEGDEGIFYYHGCREHSKKLSEYKKLTPTAGVRLQCTAQTGGFRGEINLSPEQVEELLNRAVVVDVHREWLPKTAMKALWIASVQGNPARPQGPLRVDGLVYTPNAVFSLAPKSRGADGNASKVQGRLDMRGGIVAADTGILAPGGFDLYHDPRLRPQVPYDRNVTFYREGWRLVRR